VFSIVVALPLKTGANVEYVLRLSGSCFDIALLHVIQALFSLFNCFFAGFDGSYLAGVSGRWPAPLNSGEGTPINGGNRPQKSFSALEAELVASPSRHSAILTFCGEFLLIWWHW
jgi:hypothetical protein